jgi:hypothetical protein
MSNPGRKLVSIVYKGKSPYIYKSMDKMYDVTWKYPSSKQYTTVWWGNDELHVFQRILELEGKNEKVPT